MTTLTIYDIEKLTSETNPYYFTPNVLKSFGQTMEDFEVTKQPDGRYKIKAICRNAPVKPYYSVRYFNPETNNLDRE